MLRLLCPLAIVIAWGDAQLVYPDQYERMKPGPIPTAFPTYPSSTVRGNRQQSTYANYSGYSPPLTQYAPPQAPSFSPGRVASAPAAAAAAPSSSATALGSDSGSGVDWGQHVNKIIADGVAKFGLDVERQVYRTLAQANQAFALRDNIVFSPLNIATALSLILLGSAGRTFEEVSRVLGLETGIDISRNSEVVHQMFGMLLDRVEDNFTSANTPRVDFASGLFVQDGFPIRPVYETVAQRAYRSDVINLNFQARERAQETVNAWVRQKTKNKIQKLLAMPPQPDTKLILVSALYFNGEWNQHFMPYLTKRRDFFIEPNEAIQVDFMYNGGRFMFYDDRQLGVKILRLPYKGLDTAMYVLLPTEQGATALRNFLNRISVEQIQSLIGKMRNETCIIGLPRMKLSSTLDLSGTLASLGLRSLFDPLAADLSIISPGPGSREMVTRDVVPPPAQTAFGVKSPSTASQYPVIGDDDLFIFSRFGETDNKGRQNFFAYKDKVSGLTVQQWANGFTISRNRARRETSGERKPVSYEVEGGNDDDERARTRVVPLERQKYKFQRNKRASPLRRSRRQSRPMRTDFLAYIKSLNLPSYGLDDMRNSANLVNPGLYATRVVHKVEIEVNERGTEAAASTAVFLERDGQQKKMIADRPFVFFIRHDPTEMMLFWATVNTPTPNYRVV